MLPDLLGPSLRLVVCGTAAGMASAQRQAYYAGPGNRFWQTLYDVHLTPTQLEPTQFRDLLAFGIGLTDLVKDQAGSDDAIAFAGRGPAGLTERIAQHKPRYLCFNGKRAAQEFLGLTQVAYGLQDSHIGQTRLFVAPSTSGAARRFWIPGPWEALSRLVQAS